MEVVFCILVGMACLFVGYAFGRKGLMQAKHEGDELRRELGEVRLRRELEAKLGEERLTELKELRVKWETTFQAVSAEALRKNNDQFIDLAKAVLGQAEERSRGDLEKRQQAIGELVGPLRKSLETVEQKLQLVEKARAEAYAGLQEQIKGMLDSQGMLAKETRSLVFALRSPNVRGRWGEVQLQRTVEFAGMTERVDFIQQADTRGEEGAVRPDLLVRLPGKKQIVVDAKAPLSAYLEALEADDQETVASLMKQHARHIRNHVKILASKKYWRQFDPSPEFVVLFLPGEAFFSAALEEDPTLIEYGTGENVLLATPTTLIALLKAAAYGWKQEVVTEEAREISQLGRQLYERILTQTEHFEEVGRALGRSVEAYNKSIRSMERRVLVTARKFSHLSDVSNKSLPERLSPIEERPIEAADR